MEYLPHILLLITLLIVGSQFYLYFMAKGPQGKAAPAYDDLLSAEQRGQRVLLFYFHSEHCGPCRRITPLVEALAQRSSAVVMIDVGQSVEVAQRFGVRVTPTLMRVAGGMVEKVVVGGVNEKQLNALLAE
jgi:thioredoxin 1